MNKYYLAHYGIRGQKWGTRRFQNEDGSLTIAGRRKYNVNADGTVQTKASYAKRHNRRGTIKTVLGGALALKGTSTAVRVARQMRSPSNLLTTKGMKGNNKTMNKAVLGTIIGTVIVTSGVRSFIKANSKKSFNSVGQGGTPEIFKGTPKSRKQVLAAQARARKKK